MTGSAPATTAGHGGHALRDRPVVAIDRVRFAGEPVAVVAAEDEATAEAALRLIDVEYEELPAVTTLESALAPAAPLVHDGPVRAGLFHGLGELEAPDPAAHGAADERPVDELLDEVDGAVDELGAIGGIRRDRPVRVGAGEGDGAEVSLRPIDAARVEDIPAA